MFLCAVVLFVYTRVVDLYPWDAGIKSGLTYNDPGDDTMPKVMVYYFFPSLLFHNSMAPALCDLGIVRKSTG